MPKFEHRTSGRLEEIADILDSEIMQSALSMRLVDESQIVCQDTRVCVRVYDKYFMRNENRASLSLTLVESEGEVCICAIGAGGGSGALFNFDWGAESSLVNVVERAVRKHNL